MPASSVYSVYGGSRLTSLAATLAKDSADREIKFKKDTGQLDQNNQAYNDSVHRDIYVREYYKFYHMLNVPVESVIDNPSPNKKFHQKHTVVRFSKTNQIILANRSTTTVGKVDYPIDDRDLSPETAEAYLSLWPGPLDRIDAQLKDKISNYISTLCQQDSQRRIKYCNNVDGQRKVILNILTELLNRNGRVDGPGFTKILLNSHRYQFNSDDEPLDIIEKVLLLGKRVEAAREAQSKNLWAHAMFLSYLDDPQPTKNASFSSSRDGFFVKILEDFTKTVDNKTLKIVYRSLLNRILQTESVKPRVDNDEHLFAILNANDCEMDFDQTNETFKLIIASRYSSRNHIIKLGYPNLDSYDPRDDISNRSHTSFLQGDTFASRTLTITNVDMLVLNEIWEYCINLASGTCDPSNYIHIVNLIPYKLMFAARLLDYGLHDMFVFYLNSLRNAIVQIGWQNEFKDPFYDWEAIIRCVEYLEKIWLLYQGEPEHTQPSLLPQMEYMPESKSLIPQQATTSMDYNPQPQHQAQLDTPQSDYPSLPYDYTPRPSFHQDVSDFSPELAQPEEPPQSAAEQMPMEAQVYSPPPIDELDVSRNSVSNVRPSPIEPLSPPSADELDISSVPSTGRNSNHHQRQQAVNNSHLGKTLNSLIGRIMPRSNSREMKLPDDSLGSSWRKDDHRDNFGSNEDSPQGFDAPPPPPPVMDSSMVNQINNQSWIKSTKFRYPPTSYQPQP